MTLRGTHGLPPPNVCSECEPPNADLVRIGLFRECNLANSWDCVVVSCVRSVRIASQGPSVRAQAESARADYVARHDVGLSRPFETGVFARSSGSARNGRPQYHRRKQHAALRDASIRQRHSKRPRRSLIFPTTSRRRSRVIPQRSAIGPVIRADVVIALAVTTAWFAVILVASIGRRISTPTSTWHGLAVTARMVMTAGARVIRTISAAWTVAFVGSGVRPKKEHCAKRQQHNSQHLVISPGQALLSMRG